MNDAVLQNFRDIAEAMGCGQGTDWAVCIQREGHVEVKCFGYTKERAERAAKCYQGGFAALTNDVLKARR